jgi:hypothetical protein
LWHRLHIFIRLAEDRESSQSPPFANPTRPTALPPLSPRTCPDRERGFSHCAAQFLFRVCFCKIFVCLVFLAPAPRVDLNHRTLLRLTLRGPLSWAYCHCGQAGRRDAHFVRCNSNRRSYQETFPILGDPLDSGYVYASCVD